jgi:hypothetical protein
MAAGHHTLPTIPAAHTTLSQRRQKRRPGPQYPLHIIFQLVCSRFFFALREFSLPGLRSEDPFNIRDHDFSAGMARTEFFFLKALL